MLRLDEILHTISGFEGEVSDIRFVFDSFKLSGINAVILTDQPSRLLLVADEDIEPIMRRQGGKVILYQGAGIKILPPPLASGLSPQEKAAEGESVTITYIDAPVSTDTKLLDIAVAEHCKRYAQECGLTMTRKPIITHSDPFGPMNDVKVRHRIQFYARAMSLAEAGIGMAEVNKRISDDYRARMESTTSKLRATVLGDSGAVE